MPRVFPAQTQSPTSQIEIVRSAVCAVRWTNSMSRVILREHSLQLVRLKSWKCSVCCKMDELHAKSVPAQTQSPTSQIETLEVQCVM